MTTFRTGQHNCIRGLPQDPETTEWTCPTCRDRWQFRDHTWERVYPTATFRTGQRVIYRPHPAHMPERGVVTEANATVTASRVRYGTDVLSKLTPNECLRPDESAEEIVMRAAIAGLGAAREVTALLDGLIRETRPDVVSVCVWDVAVAHRATIAAATLVLDDAIRETMPLLTWVETGTAVHRD